MSQQQKHQGVDILSRARDSYRMGDSSNALRLLKGLVQSEPENSAARLLLGQVLLKQDKYDLAIKAFAGILAYEPENVEALLQLGIVYRINGDPEDARKALEQGIALAPDRADLRYHLGNCHRQAKRLEEAREAYEKCIELDPKEALAYNTLGTVLHQLNRDDDAIQVLWRGLQVDPNNPALHLNFAQVLEARGRLAEAIREYESAVRIRPAWLDAVNSLGMAYLSAGQHGKAEETLLRLISLNPKETEARVNLASVYSATGQREKAVDCLRQALEIDPANARAVIAMERILEEAGAYADALEQLQRLARLLPANEEIRVHLGRLYSELGHLPEAVKALQEVLSANASNTEALRLLGIVHRKAGNQKASSQCFQRLVSIDPSAVSYRLDLAAMLRDSGDHKAAEKEIKAFLAQRPDDLRGRLELARLYAVSGSTPHAIQLYRELQARFPEEEAVLAELAALYQKTGDKEKAVQTMDALINLRGHRGKKEDIDQLRSSLSEYEKAVTNYSSDVRGAWSRNLRILKDAFRKRDAAKKGKAEENARNAELTAAMDPFALKAATVAGPDEGEETVFLDEGDEDLIEDNDFYEGEITTTEEPEPEAEDESADMYLNIPDMDGRPRDKLLDGEDLYGEGEARRPEPSLKSPDALGGPREDTWQQPKQEQAPQAQPYPQPPQYQPQYQQPWPQYPPPWQQPWQQQYQNPFPQQAPGPQAPPWQQPPQVQTPWPDQMPPQAAPSPLPSDSSRPSEDEVDLDMLESLEDNLLPDEKEMERLMDAIPEGGTDELESLDSGDASPLEDDVSEVETAPLPDELEGLPEIEDSPLPDFGNDDLSGFDGELPDASAGLADEPFPEGLLENMDEPELPRDAFPEPGFGAEADSSPGSFPEDLGLPLDDGIPPDPSLPAALDLEDEPFMDGGSPLGAPEGLGAEGGGTAADQLPSEEYDLSSGLEELSAEGPSAPLPADDGSLALQEEEEDIWTEGPEEAQDEILNLAPGLGDAAAGDAPEDDAFADPGLMPIPDLPPDGQDFSEEELFDDGGLPPQDADGSPVDDGGFGDALSGDIPENDAESWEEATRKLLEYLKELAEDLPDETKRGLLFTENQRKIEEIIQRLGASDDGSLAEGSPNGIEMSPPDASGAPSGLEEIAEPGFLEEKAEELVKVLEEEDIPIVPARRKGETVLGLKLSEKFARLLEIMRRDKERDREKQS